MAAIRANLRRARKKAGLSQESLAHEVGTTKQTYHLIEIGAQSIKLETALRIAARLGYDVSIMRALFAADDAEDDASEGVESRRVA